ncbi:MAG: heme A synthase [Sphaerobacteraceae bacterium]|nr:MAG: heme A synthase [Sphaerobacteraceae bacterium]
MSRFRILAISTIAVVYGLIVFGGIVRITDSGMGCGPDWPLCNGEVIPSVWTMETTLEYLHRVIALVVIILTTALLIAGWRKRHEHPGYRAIPMVAVAFVVIQSGLGAITVLLDLHAEVTTAHHALAQIFLGTLIVLGVLTFRPRLSGGHPHRPSGSSRVTRAGIVAGVATMALLLAGAYTATTGAGYACPEWPFCSGYYVPGTGSSLVDTQLIHRWLALISALAIGYLIYEIRRWRSDASLMLNLAYGLGVIMLLQIMVGAANVWTQMNDVFAALHVALATLIWALLVLIVAVDNLLPNPEPMPIEAAELSESLELSSQRKGAS